MTVEKVFFDSVKEDRGWYFVEYSPPIPSYRFATLNLVVPEDSDGTQVARAMEDELTRWLKRYPIPLMVSAFDGKGDLYNLTEVRSCGHLIGYSDGSNQEIRHFWRLLKDSEIPDDALDSSYLKEIYSNIGYKTSDDLQRESKKRVRDLRIGWIIVFIWAVVVPGIVAILEWASPAWVAALVLIYSLWKAVVKALKMLGKVKKSSRELKEEKEERRIRHHHYHCEQNPEGFLRLKLENFKRRQRARIQEEADLLKEKKVGKE